MASRKEWSDAEKRAFANGVRNKAQTFADRKKTHAKRECRNFRWKGE
jgi:hypothetical protein